VTAIDPTRCMAPRDPLPKGAGGPRCQKAATHESVMGRLCAEHAEDMRQRLRDPDTVGNLLTGGRARTEAEIERMVVPVKPTG
jgi:hypothetical protein